MRSRLTAAAVLAAMAVLGGCAEPPVVHPLGAGCTWPAGVDVQRDGVAVLESAYEGPPQVVLLKVATGAVLARCVGVLYQGVNAEFTAPGFLNDSLGVGGVALPPVSPDLRQAVVPGGVIELASGVMTPDPEPGWVSVGLAGAGAVLRVRRRDDSSSDADRAADWCVAVRADAVECEPVVGDGVGVPVAHGDGTVGWASGVPVPAMFGGLPGVVQTDGRAVLQARLDPSYRASGFNTIMDGAFRAGLFDQEELQFAPGVSRDAAGRPTWFTLSGVGPGGAVAELHTGSQTWDEVRNLDEEYRYSSPWAAAVVDGGRSVVLVLRGRSDWHSEARFIVVGETGPAREVARLRVGSGGPLTYMPRILAWPDSGPSTLS